MDALEGGQGPTPSVSVPCTHQGTWQTGPRALHAQSEPQVAGGPGCTSVRCVPLPCCPCALLSPRGDPRRSGTFWNVLPDLPQLRQLPLFTEWDTLFILAICSLHLRIRAFSFGVAGVLPALLLHSSRSSPEC